MARRHLSVEKRARQNLKRNRRNRAVKSEIRGALKKIETSSDPAQASKAVTEAQRVLDRAAAKGVMHKKKAARVKSQIMKPKAGAQASEKTE